MLVFLSHVARRFYECRSVSVFGNSQMSITHFVLSILYYIAVPFAIYTSRLQAAERSPLSMVLFVICVFGVQFCQDLTFQQLANLRNSIKYEKGGNCADKYFVPTGSMFQYVTCPHYLLEITLYLSIHIFLTTQWTSFSHILVFVVINQICSAWLNHMWYKEHFPEWANERAALFPGVL
ncbi:unnamed protein product [Calicophoron daubneyi]|uniref:Polyprenal reductase n=1 Tax=Calicophoron daubneyi TaxID=300641 RepID=A0AAV2TP98_CALDB